MKRPEARHIRWMAFSLAILLSLPVLPAPWSGLYLWGSPFYMLNAVFSGKSLVWLHLLGLSSLMIVIFRKRWICRYACPAGVICDLASGIGRKKARPWKIPVNRILATFGLVMALFNIPLLAVTDPFNMFYMGFEGFRSGWGVQALIKLTGLLFLAGFSLHFPHVWCAEVCPLGGLQLQLYELRKWLPSPKSKNMKPAGRRLFLAGSAGILAGVLVPRWWPSRRSGSIRPPFALPEKEMNWTCTRCGSCTAACPTGIIRQSLNFPTPEGLLTPEVVFSDSYCIPECNDCGTVCPSGAIQRFSVEEKKSYIMGVARINLEHCYLKAGKECNQCRLYCPYDAIEMKADGPLSARLPVVIRERCVGCGACQVVCPPGVITVDALSV
jgi:ferredoxin